MDLEVLSKADDDSTKNLVKRLTASVQSALSLNTAEANDLKNIQIDRDTLRLANVFPVGDVSSVCSKGAAVDMYTEATGSTTEVKGCSMYRAISLPLKLEQSRLEDVTMHLERNYCYS